jgi:hypothetical protein
MPVVLDIEYVGKGLFENACLANRVQGFEGKKCPKEAGTATIHRDWRWRIQAIDTRKERNDSGCGHQLRYQHWHN